MSGLQSRSSDSVRPERPSADIHNTIRLHCVQRVKTGIVYRALLDAGAVQKWLPPNGFTGKIYQLNAKVGFTCKMSFTSFSSRPSPSFGKEYVESVSSERIRHADKFDDTNLSGEMQTTISSTTLLCGTWACKTSRRRILLQGPESGG
ncbi:SRPBCC domain-containing protein [Polaromonas sp.]|uniref:SRPBCC domain-containing protein n=1 Tax=Polaromonas sp. TaxID=1869339 RepID=UPI00181E05A5|nr:SRPBCC domain-containing protein [Polaromonas sp.]NML85865.1 polyketide cyclase [Polaromonas sp.]